MKYARRRAIALVTLSALGVALGGFAAKVARGGDRQSATAILDTLDHDAAHKTATEAIVQRGRDALERATRMRATGDEAHAQLADGLALEEAETGRDLVRALEAERMGDDARRGATDAGVVGDRERALLEEGIARNGRLRAETADLGKPQVKPPQTSKLATADGGAPPPSAGKAAAAGKPATPAKPGNAADAHAGGGAR